LDRRKPRPWSCPSRHGSAGGAQGRQSNADLDHSAPDHGAAVGAVSGKDANLPDYCSRVEGMWNAGRRSCAAARFRKARKSSAKKLTASFTDTLSSTLEQEHAAEFASYAVEVLNTAGRGAGLSNQVRVALVPTLAPFGDFAAQAVNQGVNISWACPETARRRTGVKYLFRIYRWLESSPNWNKLTDVEATDCASGADGKDKIATSFLDQTIEWEKTYFYRGAVVTVVEAPEKPRRRWKATTRPK